MDEQALKRQLGIGVPTLSRAEINHRLHAYNLYGDMNVFKDVPDHQAVEVMYPTSFQYPGETRNQYEARLEHDFGPLPEHMRRKDV